MRIALIAALAQNRVVGRDNTLPWSLPGDLQNFKRLTLGKPVVMGRKTFDSIGRPLPGRSNLVISRNPQLQIEGVEVVSSLEWALQRAQEIASATSADEIMVIGGGEIYSQTLPLAQTLYLTEVHASVEGDAWFPEFEPQDWRESSRETFQPSGDNPYAFSFVTLLRR